MMASDQSYFSYCKVFQEACLKPGKKERVTSSANNVFEIIKSVTQSAARPPYIPLQTVLDEAEEKSPVKPSQLLHFILKWDTNAFNLEKLQDYIQRCLNEVLPSDDLFHG